MLNRFARAFFTRLLTPIATALLSIGVALAGLVAYLNLPVAPLPSVDLPTIVVSASQPGADPATMAPSHSRSALCYPG